MSLVLLFFLFFGAGPLLLRMLTRAEATSAGTRRLLLVAVICCGAAFMVRFFGSPQSMQLLPVAATVLLLGWAGWVAALAMGVQALRMSDPSRRMRRWTGVVGVICTTVPWFGLAYADWKGF